ncbi:MAG: IS66 family transposase [Bacteroidales bacterium]|nr:IS66 family transposase [Bacteroidales bacterium]
MQNQQGTYSNTINSLIAKNAILENNLAEKNSIILKKDSDISDKDSTITKLNIELEAARFNNEQLRRMIFGSKKERFVSNVDFQQLSLGFEPKAAEIEETVKEERELIRIEYLKKKPKKQHKGRLRLPKHLPVNEIIIEPTEDTTGMVRIGEEITEELDYSPAKLHINRFIRPKYITKEDRAGNQKQIIAELNRPIPKCIASAALISSIFTDKYVYHLPLHRILKRINKLGVPLAKSTLESWVRLAGRLLQTLYAVHRLHVFRESYQMVDESPIKVQDRDKPGACHQGYMWVRYAPLSKSALFEYYKSRSTKGPIDDLLTFNGYIQTDGYSGYTFLASKQGVTHLSCWAHARRYFDKALKNDYKRASHVMKLIQLLYAIEALARESEMTHEQRHALRLEKSLPIINEIGQYIHEQKNKVTPSSPVGKAFIYCANRWTSLQNYLSNGMLEIDSNLVENSIRPLALGRKNYLFGGSHEATKDIAMFYSFFATCNKNDIDPQKWLTYVIKNINDTKTSQLKYLLPQFFDKSLAD